MTRPRSQRRSSSPSLRAAGPVVVLCAALAFPASGAETLYVHSTLGGQITKISIPDHQVLGTIEIGHSMDYVTASPDGRVLYVNRIEGLDVPGAPSNIGESGELIAVDTRTDEVLWRVAIDGMTHHMAVSGDGRWVFVPLWDSFWLAVVDTETWSVAKKVFIGHGGHGSRISHDGRRLYVGSMITDQIVVLDTRSHEVVDAIQFDDGVRPFVLSQDDRRLYVQLSRFHGFEVVDLPTGRKVARVELPTLGRVFEIPDAYPHNVNHGLAISPDGETLLAAGSIIDMVAAFSLPDLGLLGTVDVGTDPNAIVFSEDGRHAYVSNRGSDDLSVIEMDGLTEVERIELAEYPQRMVVIDVPETD